MAERIGASAFEDLSHLSKLLVTLFKQGIDRFLRQLIEMLPAGVDLAVIATPAVTVPQIVKECAEAGLKGAIIISAGFRECGAEGRKLEEAILSSHSLARSICLAQCRTSPNRLSSIFER